MASDTTAQDPFLASIEAKIAALQALADSYRTAISVGAFGQPGEPGVLGPVSLVATGVLRPSTGPVELPTGAFRGTGMAAAIRMYLEAARRKQTFRQIADALKEGGLVSTAENFDKTLNTTLHRLKAGGELIQFKDGWDLASSYPESFKQRLVEKDTPKKTKKTRKTKKTTTVSAQPSSSPT